MKKWRSIAAGAGCFSLLFTAGTVPVSASDEITEIPELLEERLPYKPSAPEGLQQPFNMNNWCNIVTAGNMGTGTV